MHDDELTIPGSMVKLSLLDLSSHELLWYCWDCAHFEFVLLLCRAPNDTKISDVPTIIVK